MHAIAEMPATGREWQELRERAGLTVPELARLTGLRTSTLYRLEAGAAVTRSTRTLVAAALGLPVLEREPPGTSSDRVGAGS